MRTALLLLSTALTTSCEISDDTTKFVGLDDLKTTQPRSLAEGGHSTAAVPPPQISWSLSLSGIGKEDEGVPVRRWEMGIDLIDTRPGAPQDRVTLLLTTAALVDDNGATFPPTRLQEINPPDAAPTPANKPPPPRRYALIFDLPPSYKFRGVGRVTVHWGLRVQDMPDQFISSRFSR